MCYAHYEKKTVSAAICFMYLKLTEHSKFLLRMSKITRQELASFLNILFRSFKCISSILKLLPLIFLISCFLTLSKSTETSPSRTRVFA